ncbi:MAG: hypothetical protein WCZ65_04125 [Lysobacteraceae bacterium]
MRLALVIAMTTASALASADTPDYALTIYSSATPGQIDSRRLADYGEHLPGYALVRDQRGMTLTKGRAELRFTDVAARMDPTTVGFASLTDPDGTRVVEQNYQYDLVSGQKLLERFIGETISVEQTRGERLETIEGNLLSAQNGLTLQLANGQIATLTSWSGIRFPSLPGGLMTRPTLLWLLDAERGGRHEVRVSYQASGLTWWADYNATLEEKGDDCRIDLGAWVTVVNQSGGSFPDARLKLVAGEVNRAPAAPMHAPAPGVMMARMADANEGFQESGLFEYHLYTLGRRTDLPDSSTKQIELFPAAVGVKCRKDLVFTAPVRRAYHSAPFTEQGYAATVEGDVSALLAFDNDKPNGLGIALPAGRVRVNQLGADGSLEFIGEDVIGHTPRNEKISLKLGKSFDVVGERRQVSLRVDSTAKWMEETIEVEVRNRKESVARVIVRENLYRWSQWTIKDASHRHQPRDAATIDFPVDIPADGVAKVRYTARYTW